MSNDPFQWIRFDAYVCFQSHARQGTSRGDEGWILTSVKELVEIASGGLGLFHLPNPYGHQVFASEVLAVEIDEGSNDTVYLRYSITPYLREFLL